MILSVCQTCTENREEEIPTLRLWLKKIYYSLTTDTTFLYLLIIYLQIDTKRVHPGDFFVSEYGGSIIRSRGMTWRFEVWILEGEEKSMKETFRDWWRNNGTEKRTDRGTRRRDVTYVDGFGSRGNGRDRKATTSRRHGKRGEEEIKSDGNGWEEIETPFCGFEVRDRETRRRKWVRGRSYSN